MNDGRNDVDPSDEEDLVHPIPGWVPSGDWERWILAERCAREIFPDDPTAIWSATRVLFRSKIPTSDRTS